MLAPTAVPFKMAQNLVLSPNNSVNKTRNAILRMKNCSPKMRDVLRQRCKERIHQDRTKLLDRFRNFKINDDIRNALSSILVEEWKSIDCSEENIEIKSKLLPLPEINIEKELVLEEILLKELMAENEKWLLEEYASCLLDQELNEDETVVCPLCRMGTFQIQKTFNDRRVICNKCNKSFKTYKSLREIHQDIFDNVNLHNRQCSSDPEFGAVFDHEAKENLCIVCQKCFSLHIIL